VDPYIDADYVYERYQTVCEDFGEEAEDNAAIQSYLSYLEREGYVFLKRLDGVTLVTTEFPIDHLAKALEASLEHTQQAS
jgi:hypothetical protein